MKNLLVVLFTFVQIFNNINHCTITNHKKIINISLSPSLDNGSSSICRSNSQGIVVSGKIVDEQGVAIPSAKVKISTNSKLINRGDPVELSGDFKIIIPTGDYTHLSCEISAPGFENVKRTTVVNGDKAEVGIVPLKQTKGISIGDINLILDSSNKLQYLDMFIFNEGINTTEIKSIGINSKLKKETNCSDYSPAIVLEIKEDISKDRFTVLISDHAAKTEDGIIIKGTLSSLPCNQASLQLRIPLLCSIKPNVREKFRIALPREFKRKEDSLVSSLTLENWEVVEIYLENNDGSRAATALKTK